MRNRWNLFTCQLKSRLTGCIAYGLIYCAYLPNWFSGRAIIDPREIPAVSEYLRRYTDIPALIYLLTEQKITLLDPESWDDSNDSHYLALYRDKKKLKSVLALCFTQANETYHHWRVFAGGASGVCIRFKRSELLSATKKRAGLRTGSVTYLTLGKIRHKRLATQRLPFL